MSEKPDPSARNFWSAPPAPGRPDLNAKYFDLVGELIDVAALSRCQPKETTHDALQQLVKRAIAEGRSAMAMEDKGIDR